MSACSLRVTETLDVSLNFYKKIWFWAVCLHPTKRSAQFYSEIKILRSLFSTISTTSFQIKLIEKKKPPMHTYMHQGLFHGYKAIVYRTYEMCKPHSTATQREDGILDAMRLARTLNNTLCEHGIGNSHKSADIGSSNV